MTNKDSTKNKNPQKSQAKKQPSKSSKSNKKKTGKGKKIAIRIGLGILALGLVLFVAGLGYIFAIIKSTPPLQLDAVLNLNQSTQVLDRKGKFMDYVQTDEDRTLIEFKDMPQDLRDAFVSIEDERFYKHNGIDIQRILGASVTNVVKILKGNNSRPQGASTITQQLIKNTVLSNDVTIERKVREMYLAITLENKLSKDEILRAYLNTIPLGGMAYGVESGAMLYFGKSANKLNLIESAFLAGITQAPSYYAPYNPNSKENGYPYLERTKTVLSMMLKNGYISQEEHDKAVKDVDNKKLKFKAAKKDYRINYEYFTYPAIKQVKEDLKEKYKYTDEEVNKYLMNGGLKIYTTMDKKLQDLSQEVVDDYKNLHVSNAETFDENGTPKLQASVSIMDYRTGEVLVMVGGRKDKTARSLNRAYDGLRPIGSTTKPLTVFGPAIDQKIITSATPIDDVPLPPSIGKLYPTASGPYNPNNHDNTYLGYITAYDALTYSKNVASVRTEHNIGISTGVSYGEKLGLVYNARSKSSIAALSLGQFDNDPADKDGANTTLMASAFGSFANGGVRTEPMLYSKVVDANGKVILEATPEKTQVYSKETAYIMYDLLKGPVKSFNSSYAKWGDMPVIGKTGTTEHSNDLWFAGATPYLSGSVWVGYDTPQTIYGDSGYTSASVWAKIMKVAHEGKKVKEIEKPSDVVSATFCIDSGKKPTDLCKNDGRGSRVRTGLFIKGTEPKGLCETHVTAKVNKKNNLLATDNTPKYLIQERIFIKKKDPYKKAKDYPYVLPTKKDDTKAPEVNKPNNEENGENQEGPGSNVRPETPVNPDKPNNPNNPNKPNKPDNPDENQGETPGNKPDDKPVEEQDQTTSDPVVNSFTTDENKVASMHSDNNLLTINTNYLNSLYQDTKKMDSLSYRALLIKYPFSSIASFFIS